MSLTQSLRRIEGTTELELEVESSAAESAAQTARAAAALFSAATVAAVGTAVYWVLQLVSAEQLWNTKYCAFLIRRVDLARANDPQAWPHSGLGTALSINSPFVRRMLFTDSDAVAVDALALAFTTSQKGMDFRDLLLNGNSTKYTADQQAVAFVTELWQRRTLFSQTQSVFSEVCAAVKGVYGEGAVAACSSQQRCPDPSNALGNKAVWDGINTSVQCGAAGLMAGMLANPIAGVVAALFGIGIGVWQGVTEAQNTCTTECPC